MTPQSFGYGGGGGGGGGKPEGRSGRGVHSGGPPAFVARRSGAALVTAHLTQQQLESYLWGAATLLRGVIDDENIKLLVRLRL